VAKAVHREVIPGQGKDFPQKDIKPEPGKNNPINISLKEGKNNRIKE
jgi:hypothetical protein